MLLIIIFYAIIMIRSLNNFYDSKSDASFVHMFPPFLVEDLVVGLSGSRVKVWRSVKIINSKCHPLVY